MASFFNIGSRFGRQAPRNPQQPSDRQPSPTSAHPPTLPYLQPLQTPSGRFTPTLQSPTTETPSFTALGDIQSMSNPPAPVQNGARRLPFFFREENSALIVKGNFMTLAAQPVHVDKGEWLAHQVVEQYRLLESWIKIIQETDQHTGFPICNIHTCPTMSAGGYVQTLPRCPIMEPMLPEDLMTEPPVEFCANGGRGSSYIYTWLDKQRNPVKIPAFQYIQLVQQWTMGKIGDTRLFPTDTNTVAPAVPTPASNQPNTNSASPLTPIPVGPTTLNDPLTTLSGNVDQDWLGKVSGFPESFAADIRNLYRQMFRCYAHLYHSHWVEPFWHLGATKELNTCFIHFVNVGKLFDLLEDKDIVPMQPLIDIWLAKGLLPKSGQDAQQQLGGSAKTSGANNTPGVAPSSAAAATSGN